MDLGYTVFVSIYYRDVNKGERIDIENFPFGENSPLSLVIYTLDFFICMILLFYSIYMLKKHQKMKKNLKTVTKSRDCEEVQPEVAPPDGRESEI
jgi:heme/copper-type cytochrome/quinol oxidase subunit 2